MNISITIIIPVYNVEKYLEQCLDSVIEQSVPFDEVILINDGSTDKSFSICKKYASEYDYFKLINQENRGLSVARNQGLKYATNEYVMFLDSDDYLRADTVERLKNELNRFGQDAVYFDAGIRCEDDCIMRENIYDRNLSCLDGILMSGWEFFMKCYPKNYTVSACMAVYKKSVIVNKKITFPKGLYYEDNFFSFVFMTHAGNITYIPEKLYQRRYRKNSITISDHSEKKIIDYIKIVSLIYQEIVHIKNVQFPEQNKVLLTFIDDYCRLALYKYRLYIEQGIALGRDTKTVLIHMIKRYELLLIKYFLESQDDREEDLALLNRVLETLQQIALLSPENKIYTEYMIKKLREKQKYLYQILLRSLPLSSKQYKVGIYGTGKHTEGLLSAFENIIGKIACNLIFLDSYKKNGSYRGKKIINYQQVDNSFDFIVISSFLYEQQMVKNIRRVNRNVFIYSFYNVLKDDVFSDWKIKMDL